MASALIAVQKGFRTLLEKLSEQHGGKDGPWFDELEGVLIRDAKGTVTEGSAKDADGDLVKFGVDILQSTLHSFRRTLVVKD